MNPANRTIPNPIKLDLLNQPEVELVRLPVSTSADGVVGGVLVSFTPPAELDPADVEVPRYN